MPRPYDLVTKDMYYLDALYTIQDFDMTHPFEKSYNENNNVE